MADPVISRLQAALATATNEVTVAAANINFDFCLVKYDAPKEYQQLGLNLSQRRKQDAETGKSHVTARRLAALFEGFCPPTPKLVSAYGKRVSEIAKLATDAVSKDYSNSIFSAYTGVDATSIWAAATSSNDPNGGAIQVHLLACILASIWDASEATSIWVEFINERKRNISLDLESGAALPFSLAAAAAQQEISRTQLAEWDSSARSWIETADKVMNKEQTQLRLIIKNIDLPVGNEKSVYPSVMGAWRTGLTVMEHLISGIPQEIHDGTPLLSLLAWNLYPDIHVFGMRETEVRMGDPLVCPGGILSLGCSPSASTPANGISWSLSLAHLRHYGHPVQKDASNRGDPSKLTFPEFRQVILGCILEVWKISEEEQEYSLQALHKLSVAIIPSQESRTTKSPFQFIQDAIDDFRVDKELGMRLIRLGRKRPNFLPVYTDNTAGATFRSMPFFGFLDSLIFLSRLKGNDSRVTYLRRVGSRDPDLEERCPFIRYSSAKTSGDSHAGVTINAADFTTVLPLSPDDSSQSSYRQHVRWILDHKLDEVYYASRQQTYVNETVKYLSHDQSQFTNIAPTSFHHMNEYGIKSTYSLFYGDCNHASIFVRDATTSGSFNTVPVPQILHVTIEDVLWAMQHDLLHTTAGSDFWLNNKSMLTALACLHEAGSVFTLLPYRIIQTQMLSKPLTDSHWVQYYAEDQGLGVHHYYTPVVTQFSILSYFVAGCNLHMMDVPPNVMGASVADSIYVLNTLLDDPLQSKKKPFITRILGNIGRPGFVLFSSVEIPMMSPIDESRWRLANMNPFNGKAENALTSTSMHLSFTDWERAINASSEQGNRDAAFMEMEVAVCIRERGKWIGDVDLIAQLRSTKLYYMPPQQPCQHLPGAAPSVVMGSIESWDELRDIPPGNVVVRAHGNWLGRLAVAGFLAQCAEEESSAIDRITICPQSVCWSCLKPEFARNVYIY